jgi:hypothetical protein
MALVVLGWSVAWSGCRLDTTDPIPTEPMTLVGADRQSRIYVVDEASAAVTVIDTVFIQHPLDRSFSSPAGAIASMTWVPSNDRWWVATTRSGSVCSSCIFEYDPSLPLATYFRTNIGEVDTIADFAEHPTNGRLYTFPVARGGSFYRVDGRNASYDQFYSTVDEGSSGKGATFGSDGFLYVAGGLFEQRLTRVDINGPSRTVGPITYVGFPPFDNYSVTVQAMATRKSDGVVFGLVHDGGGWAGNVTTTYLATVDVTSAIVTNIGATAQRLSALAYVPTRLLPTQ